MSREKNIIIFGLPEPRTNDKLSDVTAVNELLNTVSVHDNIKACFTRRIGTPTSSSKPRPVKVILENRRMTRII